MSNLSTLPLNVAASDIDYSIGIREISISSAMEQYAEDPIQLKRVLSSMRHKIRLSLFSKEIRENIELRKGQYVVCSLALSKEFNTRHADLVKSLDEYAKSKKSGNGPAVPNFIQRGTYDSRGKEYECLYISVDELENFCTYWLSRKTTLENSEMIQAWIKAISYNSAKIYVLNSMLQKIESSLLNVTEASAGLTTRFPLYDSDNESLKYTRVHKSSVHPLSLMINNARAAELKGITMTKNAREFSEKYFSELKDFRNCSTVEELERVETENIHALGGIEQADALVEKIKSENAKKFKKQKKTVVKDAPSGN